MELKTLQAHQENAKSLHLIIFCISTKHDLLRNDPYDQKQIKNSSLCYFLHGHFQLPNKSSKHIKGASEALPGAGQITPRSRTCCSPEPGTLLPGAGQIISHQQKQAFPVRICVYSTGKAHLSAYSCSVFM